MFKKFVVPVGFTQVKTRGTLQAMKKENRKKFLGIMFECCNVYHRIYINKEDNAYEGRCPKCFAEVRALIGEDGSTSRFFRAR